MCDAELQASIFTVFVPAKVLRSPCVTCQHIMTVVRSKKITAAARRHTQRCKEAKKQTAKPRQRRRGVSRVSSRPPPAVGIPSIQAPILAPLLASSSRPATKLLLLCPPAKAAAAAAAAYPMGMRPSPSISARKHWEDWPLASSAPSLASRSTW